VPANAPNPPAPKPTANVVTEYRVNGALRDGAQLAQARSGVLPGGTADGDGHLDVTPHGTRDTPVYFKLYEW
jgi:hypothetical protein